MINDTDEKGPVCERLIATVVYLCNGKEILLAYKPDKLRPNKPGAGYWNGYGGRVHPGELPREAAVRELKEESSVIAFCRDLQKMAITHYCNIISETKWLCCEVHNYMLFEWSGNPTSSETMVDPTWYAIDKNKLPFLKMMAADREWLLEALSGKRLSVCATYDGPNQEVLFGPVAVREVDEFPNEVRFVE